MNYRMHAFAYAQKKIFNNGRFENNKHENQFNEPENQYNEHFYPSRQWF